MVVSGEKTGVAVALTEYKRHMVRRIGADIVVVRRNT
jgi:hypothetical protein